jgi:site-specific recombinase XerD
MSRRNPLEQALAAQLQLLQTTLQPGTMNGYRRTVRLFLEFLQRRFPDVTRPSQLQRDPHLLGWLEDLWTYRTSQGQPLKHATRGARVLQLRTLLELMETSSTPPRPGLLRSSDVPRRQFPLPRPLTADEDARLGAYWGSATGVLDTALHLMRLTGIRIGECVDLAPDCLRHLGDNQWFLHVPHGKPQSERWVPVEDRARQLVERLAFLRTLPAGADGQFLLARPSSRGVLMQSLRQQLRLAASQAGLTRHIVPHQLRHTYATTLLRAGVSLPALMRLLGHHNANMTLIYVEVTQQDLHRQYQAALEHPRYLAPTPPQLGPPDAANLAPLSLEGTLTAALRLLGQLCAGHPPSSRSHSLVLLRRRLLRIQAALRRLLPDGQVEK